jgi:hypothetical protein
MVQCYLHSPNFWPSCLWSVSIVFIIFPQTLSIYFLSLRQQHKTTTKVKLTLCLINKALCHEDIWGSGGIAPPFLTSALDGGEWSASRPYRIIPRERAPGTHWVGGWVGPRAGLDAVEEKHFALPGIEPGASSPSLYRLRCLAYIQNNMVYLYLCTYRSAENSAVIVRLTLSQAMFLYSHTKCWTRWYCVFQLFLVRLRHSDFDISLQNLPRDLSRLSVYRVTMQLRLSCLPSVRQFVLVFLLEWLQNGRQVILREALRAQNMQV